MLQRTGDTKTFFYFNCVNTLSSAVYVLLGKSAGREKLEI